MGSVFADWFTREADAEFLEDLAVDFAGHDGGVHLAAVEQRQAQGPLAVVLADAYVFCLCLPPTTASLIFIIWSASFSYCA